MSATKSQKGALLNFNFVEAILVIGLIILAFGFLVASPSRQRSL